MVLDIEILALGPEQRLKDSHSYLTISVLTRFELCHAHEQSPTVCTHTNLERCQWENDGFASTPKSTNSSAVIKTLNEEDFLRCGILRTYVY